MSILLLRSARTASRRVAIAPTTQPFIRLPTRLASTFGSGSDTTMTGAPSDPKDKDASATDLNRGGVNNKRDADARTYGVDPEKPIRDPSESAVDPPDYDADKPVRDPRDRAVHPEDEGDTEGLGEKIMRKIKGEK